MKNSVYMLVLILLFGVSGMRGITAVYAINKTSYPVSLEIVTHYHQKKIASSTAYGGFIYQRVDATETSTVSVGSSRALVAESGWIDNVIVRQAMVTTPSGAVTITINRSFALQKGHEADSATDQHCAIITINADHSYTVVEDTTNCSR